MKKNDKSNGKMKGVGPNIVRAWFDTVINPLIAILEEEQQLLKEKNWSWLYKQKALGYIKYSSSLLDSKWWPNREQLEMFYPHLRKHFEENDKNVLELTKSCERLHNALKKHPALFDIYQATTSPDELSKLETTLTAIFGAYSQEDHIQLIAQYIVNNTNELPFYYPAALYWNRYRTRFLALLKKPEIRDLNVKTVEAGRNLLGVVKDIAGELKKIRESLSLEYDLPLVSGL